MALTSDQITALNFKDFYGQIRPYLNGSAHGGFTPIGTVISVMGKQAPHNYLVCDGTVYNIADYPELAAYFAGQFNASNFFGGNGTTTFAVPDLRGEFLRGTGTNSHADQGSGAAVGVHQDSTEISNIFYDTSNNLVAPKITQSTYEWYIAKNADAGKVAVNTFKYNTSSGNETSVSGSAYNLVRPTNTSVLYCIATKNIFMDAGCNYSTDEQVIGTWIDGKPLYQKTIIVTHQELQIAIDNPCTNQNVKDIRSLNIENIAKYHATVKQQSNATDYYYYDTPTISPQYVQNVAQGSSYPGLCFNFWIRVGYIGANVTGMPSNIIYTLYFTVQYTKTTD